MPIAIAANPSVDTRPLAEKLAKEKGWKLLHDPSRQLCESYGFQTLYEIPLPLQLSLRRRLMEEHAEVLYRQPNLVCSFSILEWTADWMRWLWSHTKAEEWEEIYALAREAAGLYGELHRLRVGPVRAYDGYAWLDERNAAQVDRLIDHLMQEWGLEQKTKQAA